MKNSKLYEPRAGELCPCPHCGELEISWNLRYKDNQPSHFIYVCPNCNFSTCKEEEELYNERMAFNEWMNTPKNHKFLAVWEAIDEIQTSIGNLSKSLTKVKAVMRNVKYYEEH